MRPTVPGVTPRSAHATAHFSTGAGLCVWALSMLASCTSLGPDFQRPEATAPATWRDRSSSAVTRDAEVPGNAALPDAWWKGFGEPTLDALEAKAAAANPDLRTAALRFSQSRLQRRVAAAQAAPQVALNAQASRQRQSEYAAETRLVNAIGGASAPALVDVLSTPFPLYQAGFDVSWELDLWGRVRRSVEAADARIDVAGAQFADVRLLVSSELARAYFELREAQRRLALLDAQLVLSDDLRSLQAARAANGLSDQTPPLAAAERVDELAAQRAALRARLAALFNQIGLLTGDEPGALNALLAMPGDVLAALDSRAPDLPALTLGEPADLLRRRPDVRAAEARLHAATADIGVATADLYPRIALGASVGYQSVDAGSFGDWASRNWQIGPVLSLPVFDRGRRRATVVLRRVEQQSAAVAWQQSVAKAWQELDDALTGLAAERERNRRLRDRAAISREQWRFAEARAANGLVDAQLPAQRELAWRQAQAEVLSSDCQLQIGVVRVYKAAGGGGTPEDRARAVPPPPG